MVTKKPAELVRIRFVRHVEGGRGPLQWHFVAGEVHELPAALAAQFLAPRRERRGTRLVDIGPDAIPADQPWGPPPPASGGLEVRIVRTVERGDCYYPVGHRVTLEPREAHRLVKTGFAEWTTPRLPDPPVRVRFHKSIAGYWQDGSGFDFGPGQVAEIPRSVALAWARTGVCTETDAPIGPAPVTAAALDFMTELAVARARAARR